MDSAHGDDVLGRDEHGTQPPVPAAAAGDDTEIERTLASYLDKHCSSHIRWLCGADASGGAQALVELSL
jgi:hypothetical protein